MPFFVLGRCRDWAYKENQAIKKKKIFPAEKRTVVFRRKLKFFAKSVVILNFTLVFITLFILL
jgi:hypothetical protein